MLRASTTVLVLCVTLAGCTADGDTSSDDRADNSTSAPMTTLTITDPPTTSTTTLAPAPTTTETPTTSPPPTTSTTTPPTTLLPVTDLEAGLFCRDLFSRSYDYATAVTYWVREGSPDRMDADRNGIPCETVYPETDVVAFWGSPLPTTTALTIVYAPDDPMQFPPVLPGSDNAHGSGCAPGTDTMPDGIWFGYVTARPADRLDFDLACIWTGAEAHRRTEEAGEVVVVDYFISNEVSKIRSPAIATGAMVYHLTGNPWFTALTYGEWRNDACHGFQDHSCPVWLYINGGNVTAVVEQFFA